MEKTNKRAPVRAGSPRSEQARVRLRWAQCNNNRVADVRTHAFTGAHLINAVKKSRNLHPFHFDLLDPQLLDPDGKGEVWEPTKRAAKIIGCFAQVLTNWTILEEGHPHYGEKYRCIEASAAEIAEAFDMSAKQWYRSEYRDADGNLVAMPGTRAWLMHYRLLRVSSTTKNRPSWWRNRHGNAMNHAEEKFVYELGPAAEELVKLHTKRKRRSRRRAVNDHKRAVIAKRIRRSRKPLGKLCQPKACVVSSSLREEPTNTPTPRGTRTRKQPLIRQMARESPVVDGVGGRRRKAPAAPPADRRHDRCSSPQQTRNEPESDGHEGPGFAAGGGELETARQAAPLARGEARCDAGGTAPPAAGDDATGGAALVPVVNGEVIEFDLKRLVASTLRQIDPDQARREALYGPAPPPKLIAGHQNEAIGSTPETLLAFTDPADLIGFVQRQADERFAAQARWKRKNGMPLTDADKRAEEGRRRRGRDLASSRTGPAAALGSAFGELLGAERTPEERAENERRREESKKRARGGANADVDFVGDEQREETPDDDDGGAA